MTNKEFDSEEIEKYLRHELSSEEHQAFENNLLLNPALAEEAKFQEQLVRGMNAYFCREQLKPLLQETEIKLRAEESRKGQSGKGYFPWLIAMAASFLLLITAGYFILADTTSAPQLYEAYYQPYPNIAAPLERSGNEEVTENPFALYEQRAYELAVPAFEKAMKNQQNPQPALRFYYALSLLQTDKTAEAIDQLKAVSTARDTRFFSPSRWYLALAYLKQDTPGEAKRLLKELSAGNSAYQEKAKQLSRDL